MHEPDPSYSQRSWRSLLNEPLKVPSADAKVVSFAGAYEINAIAVVNRHVAEESAKLIKMKQKEYFDNEERLNNYILSFEEYCNEYQKSAVIVRRPVQFTPDPSELTQDPELKDVPDQALLTYVEKRNALFSKLVEEIDGIIVQVLRETKTIKTFKDALETTKKDILQAETAVRDQQNRIQASDEKLHGQTEPDEKILSEIAHNKDVLARKEKKVTGLNNLLNELQDQLKEQQEALSLLLGRLLPQIETHIASYEREAKPTPLTQAQVTESVNRQCRIPALDFRTEAQQRTIESICEQALSKSIREADSMLENLPFAHSSCAQLRTALDVVITLDNISPDFKQALEDLTQTHRQELGGLIRIRARGSDPHLRVKALKEAAADYALSSKRLDDASREPSFNNNQKKVLLIQAMQFQFLSHCCSNDAAIHKKDQKQGRTQRKKKRF